MKKTILYCLIPVFIILGCGGGNNNGPGPGPGPSPTPSQAVFVEFDKMTGTDFPPDFATSSTITFQGIYAGGNLALDVRKDDASIPAEATVTPQRLHQIMIANRSAAFAETSGKWSTYAIVVKAFQPNPDVLGIMFDSNVDDLDNLPREGCAIFYDAHADGWSGQRLANELFLTSAHELGHNFNLHHTDWEGTSFNSNSTIMGYSLAPTVKWKLSNRSAAHLSERGDHPVRYVKPRTGAKPFGTVTQHHCDNHQSTPIESYTCEVNTSSVTRK